MNIQMPDILDSPDGHQAGDSPGGDRAEVSGTEGVMATQGTTRPATARQVIAWLDTLTVTEGPRAGERLRLVPFQRQFVRGLMGHQEAALSIARGNGKTTLAAALAACALAGPLANVRAQTIIVASSFTQAKIAFQHVLWFLRPVCEADRRRNGARQTCRREVHLDWDPARGRSPLVCARGGAEVSLGVGR